MTQGLIIIELINIQASHYPKHVQIYTLHYTNNGNNNNNNNNNNDKNCSIICTY